MNEFFNCYWDHKQIGMDYLCKNPCIKLTMKDVE